MPSPRSSNSRKSVATKPTPPKKPIWFNLYATIKEKLRDFNKELIALLIYTVILSVIANLTDPSTIACWTHYFIPHETTLIHNEPYHIGDVELSLFKHSPPQLNPFVKSFHICRVVNEMKLVLTAVHVDPDITTSPVPIYINGSFIDYLNNYSPREMDEPYNFEIPIANAQSILEVGDNVIMIISGADYRGLEYGTYNTDDIEFWDLRIQR
jgi:hypothetical protein